MKSVVSLLSVALAGVGLSLAAAPTPANATILFETAAYTGVDTGEYIIQDTRFIGAAFTLTKSREITGIGGQFGGYPSGSVFGAIVPLASQTSLPSFAPSAIASNAVADVVFSLPTVTAIDFTAPLDVTLPAGSYAVIFGSGAFGASGWGGLGDQNTPIGSPNYVSYFSFDGDVWSGDSYDGVRITVSGVPEASTWAMLIAGFAGLGLCGYRAARRSEVTA